MINIPKYIYIIICIPNCWIITRVVVYCRQINKKKEKKRRIGKSYREKFISKQQTLTHRQTEHDNKLHTRRFNFQSQIFFS